MSLLQDLMEYYNTNIKPEDVQAKLTSFNTNTKDNQNTTSTVFGLDDSKGNIIKVYVKDEQAKKFEETLASKMREINPDDPYAPEVAEILFDLRKQFDITNIEWPTYSEDEEQETDQFDTNSEQLPPGDEGLDPNAATTPAPSSDPSEMMNSVIQAMMADSEARRQESLARAAEARAKEAEAAARMADNKLKAEEEVADMEAYYDTQNSEKKEAKKLAKLAKYRHTLKQDENQQGRFNNFSDSLNQQDAASDDRLDQPTGENPPGTDPGSAPTNSDELDTPPIEQRTGFENEELVPAVQPQHPQDNASLLANEINRIDALLQQIKGFKSNGTR